MITIGETIYNSKLNKSGIVKECGRQWVTVKNHYGSTETWKIIDILRSE